MKSKPDWSNLLYQRTAELILLFVPLLLWFNFTVGLQWAVHAAWSGSWVLPDWVVLVYYFIWPFFLSQWPFGRNEFLRHLRRALNNASWL